MYKIILSHSLVEEAMHLFDGRAEIYVANAAKPDEYYDQLKDADGVLLRLSSFDREGFKHAPKLKVIGKTGVGYDAIDVDAATEYGVPVVITPGANSLSVAEHAVALAFALSKNLVEGHNELLKNNYGIRNAGKAFEMYGKTVGFVGFGAIGKLAANIFSGIGMKVVVYDPYLAGKDVESLGYAYAERVEDIYSVSDFVTIHVPLTKETEGMINMDAMKMMKRSAMLINCARGPVVNEKDLVTALNEGVIAGAGLDVTENEPPKPDDPILKAKNVILSPHSAAQTSEAVYKMAEMCVNGMFDVLDGKEVKNIANPKVYEHKRWR